MAEFEVKAVKVDRIDNHPNADALELAVIGGYRAIVKIGEFTAGDLVIYIPEASVLPEWLIERLGLTGRLAGKNKNRVKAIKLRGVLSQGLVYPLKKVDDIWSVMEYEKDGEIKTGLVSEGTEVSDLLGIVKYEPPIPVSMAGEVVNLFGKTIRYDIENMKKYPDVIWDGEEVVMTEKIHGTFCGIGYWPGLGKKDLFENGDVFTFSKGLGAQGLVFRDSEANKNNLYVRNLIDLIDGIGWNIINRIKLLFERAPYYHKNRDQYPNVIHIKEFYKGGPKPVYILGEIYGKGIQDLTYGNDNGSGFRVFDIYVGEPGQGRYLDWGEMEWFCYQVLDLHTVPVIYRGQFDTKLADEFCSGMTSVDGGSCIREGVVIKPVEEREDALIGRAIVKHVSEEYLLRKNATEYN